MKTTGAEPDGRALSASLLLGHEHISCEVKEPRDKVFMLNGGWGLLAGG